MMKNITMQERDIKKVSLRQKIVKTIVTTLTYIFLVLVAISILLDVELVFKINCRI